MSNYAIKAYLKNAAGVGILDFAKKTDLANLKFDVDKLDIYRLNNVPSNLSNLESKVNKLDIGKLETTSVDLSKFSNVVKMMSLKGLNMMNWLKTLIILIPLILVTYLNKLTITQKLMKLKIKLPIMIMIKILLLKNLIN